MSPPGDEDAWAPEKFRVKTADGKLDLAATAKKIAGSNVELEKRMKDVGLPPESPDKYEIKVDDAVKAVVDEVVKSPTGQQFLKDAHAAGFSNKQINLVLAAFGKEIAETAEGAVAVRADECDESLRKAWPADKDFTTGKGRAFQATTVFAKSLGIPMADIDAALGNSPVFIRIMEAVGREMGEDLPPLDLGASDVAADFQQQAEKLRGELDKLELHDPQRKVLQGKLDALYQRRYPQTRPLLQAGGRK